MATTFLGLYRNAAKGVGQQIVADFHNSTPIAVGEVISTDYALEANTVVTDVAVTKTGLDSAINQVTTVRIMGVDYLGTEFEIAQIDLTPAAEGVVAVGSVVRANTTGGLMSGSLTGTLARRLSGILAVAPTAGLVNGSQKIRIRVSTAKLGGAVFPYVAAGFNQLDLQVVVKTASFNSAKPSLSQIASIELTP